MPSSSRSSFGPCRRSARPSAKFSASGVESLTYAERGSRFHYIARMQKHSLLLAMLTGLLASASCMAGPSFTRLDVTPQELQPLDARVQGRVSSGKYQWPGTYAEVAFKGTEIDFTAGPEPVILNVWLDGAAIAKLVKP